MTLARRIAQFVVGLDDATLPEFTRDRLRACLINGFGIALGGLDTPFHRVAADAAIALDGSSDPGATLLGDGRRASLDGALSANCALFHGRAQEDTCGTVHLGAIVIPMLTALVEARGLPLERLLPALLSGYEVAGLFDAAYGAITAPGGLRASILYGTLGAAAAAAKLMDLDADRTAAALANAAAFTGGTLQSFADGTDEWRYQLGVAAANGLRAAALAAAGSVSAPAAFEGRAGFVRAFVRTDCDVEALVAGLGRDWAIDRVTFKPYPVCAFNQSPVDAALALRARLGGRRLAAVTVRMNPYETGYAGMLERGPFATISGTLMSIPFCIATTLLHGVPDMRRMTDYHDAAVADLIARLTVVTDPAVPNLSADIEATTTDGEVVIERRRASAADYTFDRAGAAALVRRIGAEQGLDPSIHDRLERFVDGLPGGSIDELLSVFAAARSPVLQTRAS